MEGVTDAASGNTNVIKSDAEYAWHDVGWLLYQGMGTCHEYPYQAACTRPMYSVSYPIRL